MKSTKDMNEDFNKIYEECLENMPMASDELQNAYRSVRKADEEYYSLVMEETFRYAYQCGYEAAQRGGARA